MIFPAPNAFASLTSIIPAGPAPSTAISSPFWKLHLFNALIQHANGSISEASSNVIVSGNFITPPWETFHSGY